MKYEYKANPMWIPFWGSLAGIGYLVSDIRGAVVGLVIGMALSFIASVLVIWNDW